MITAGLALVSGLLAVAGLASPTRPQLYGAAIIVADVALAIIGLTGAVH